MPRPKLTGYITTGQVARLLNMKVSRLLNWIGHGVLPPPTWVDNNGVRYFDQEWLSKAKEIVKRKGG
ncbi:hypothetical protein ES705_35876 [subsurface metagenome]